jgi:hypothetical protein
MGRGSPRIRTLDGEGCASHLRWQDKTSHLQPELKQPVLNIPVYITVPRWPIVWARVGNPLTYSGVYSMQNP